MSIYSLRSRAGGAVAAPWMSPTDRTRYIPREMAAAVDEWARQWGRRGTIGWNAALNCAVIDLSLKPDDPRMQAWQEGRLKHEPKESIPLNWQPKGKQYFEPINLEELGVSGLIDMLDKANAWSGRGEYSSMMEAVNAVERKNEELREMMRKAALDNCRDRARDMRRQILDLPLVSVPENIGDNPNG